MGKDKCGPTHYAGCLCHEAAKDARIAELEAALEWILKQGESFDVASVVLCARDALGKKG